MIRLAGAAAATALLLAACGENLDDTVEHKAPAPPPPPEAGAPGRVDKLVTHANRLSGAEQGAAFFRIGGMYETGRGAVQDAAVALQYYRQAAELGNEDAKEALKRLGED